MNISKLKKLQLLKLIELKSITTEFCDKYSKMLTDYSVTQTTGQQLMEMTPSQKENFEYMVSEIGVVFYAIEGTANEAGVRLVGYLDKNCKITTGDGTKEKPYTITK